MTGSRIAALFVAMVVLAALPSVSVLTVVARTTSAGLWHGVLTSLGIVLGDVMFILLAVYGMAAIAHTLGSFFFLIKYLGAAYLITLGISLWRAQAGSYRPDSVHTTSWLSSLLSGLLITLGDQKAILFYMGFLPAFLDLSKVSLLDTGLLITTAAFAVGGVKIGYAALADRARSLFNSRQATTIINRMAGGIMICTGIVLIAKT